MLTYLLDSVWPLLGVGEWLMTVLSKAMRDVVLEQVKKDWIEADAVKNGNCHITPRPLALTLRSFQACLVLLPSLTTSYRHPTLVTASRICRLCSKSTTTDPTT